MPYTVEAGTGYLNSEYARRAMAKAASILIHALCKARSQTMSHTNVLSVAVPAWRILMPATKKESPSVLKGGMKEIATEYYCGCREYGRHAPQVCPVHGKPIRLVSIR